MASPAFSKGRVRAAGVAAVSDGVTDEALDESLAVVNYWRGCHQEPLLRAFDDVSDALPRGMSYALAGRIKKLDTILDKLRRDYYTGNLSNMRDIAGLRLVVPDMDHLRSVCAALEGCPACCVGESTRCDYVSRPKRDGYRGRHYILRYTRLESGYDNLCVELQVRTEMQHQWATAVEMYDTAMGSRLKFDSPDKQTIPFFARMSMLIKLLEEGEGEDADRKVRDAFGVSDEAMRECLEAARVLKAASSSFAFVGQEPVSVDGASVLIELDPEVQTISASAYDERLGIERYFAAEDEHPERNTLLVRASSMEFIKRLYPNYFGDISSFLKLFDVHLPAFV